MLYIYYKLSKAESENLPGTQRSSKELFQYIENKVITKP